MGGATRLALASGFDEPPASGRFFLSPAGDLAVLVDPLGGRPDVACELALQPFSEGPRDLPPAAWLTRTFDAANQRMLAAQQRGPDWRGIGAVLAAVLLDGATAYAANVGDARGYLLRDGRLDRLTADHSLGSLFPGAEVPGNVIVRALGMQDARPDVRDVALRTGDILVLCSDGLSAVVPEAEMATLLACVDLTRAIPSLVRRAATRGGPDDPTAVALSFVTPGV
jgi:protein phosphatase